MCSSLPQSLACASKPLLWPALLFPMLLLPSESINYITSVAVGPDAWIAGAFLFLTLYFFLSQRMSCLQKNPNEERQQQEAEVTGANPAYHCHSYSQAYENRKREQHQAGRKLCVASVICTFFMIAEITGKYCSKRAQSGAQHSHILALSALWLQGPCWHGWTHPALNNSTLSPIIKRTGGRRGFRWNDQNIFIYSFKNCIW